MGRIKTRQIKRVGNKLIKIKGDKFTKDFQKNKELVPLYVNVGSKKLKNVLAGYLTHLKKISED